MNLRGTPRLSLRQPWKGLPRSVILEKERIETYNWVGSLEYLPWGFVKKACKISACECLKRSVGGVESAAQSAPPLFITRFYGCGHSGNNTFIGKTKSFGLMLSEMESRWKARTE